ncbi:methyltransferase [Hirsutella rhossiliensis]|uniref:Methyltransferase domain-containing protein n=1 Tax=Hirsutella rhossiliensis TaxID=111463 RepID=A0A9P8SMU3_9HYPO|nr:methyltransferase domain-containing protein [Hirsutella rhossiliensis]KAH0968371.1 methyltransferase domain-containing protein [Hirsutella rhossiliensis]
MSQYDSIGTRYDVIKTTSFNELERFNFQKSVGPFLQQAETAVLDLACGTGFYSCLLLDWGAGSVTGVDLSARMLAGAEARLSQTRHAKRARFVQGDGLAPKTYSASLDAFEVVTGAWFLNYAQDVNQLTCMFRTISTNLKSGGVFVGICFHPTDDVTALASALHGGVWAETGVCYRYREELPGGIGYQVQVFGLPQPGAPPSVKGVDFMCYHLKKCLYEEAARAGDMQGRLEWRSCEFLGEEWRREVGLDGNDEDWRRLQECPPLSILVVWKD